MITKIYLIIILLSSFLLFAKKGNTCTTFCIDTEDELVFGKNYDWSIDFGIVFVNKKGVIKTAFTKQNNPAEWISKYGSVSFNQFGREFPMGGMNESGLVVELMWLDEAKYPEPDDRETTGGILQWIQYQLDNCETIQEVIDTDKFLRIPAGSIPVHYLITDKYGNSAAIEFLKGKLVQHSGETLKYMVLANDTYEKSVDNLKYYKDFGGMMEITDDESSFERFARSCQMINNYSKDVNGNAVDYGFEILNRVDQGSATKWSIVYDIKNMIVYFKTIINNNIKSVDFASLDFNCSTPVMMIDINSDLEGNINSSLTEYSSQSNIDLIEKSYNGVDFLRRISKEDRDWTSSYAESLKCR
jgi:choloylglycine hydrolase